MIELTVAGEKIQATFGHPFWVIEGEELDSRPRREHIVKASVGDTSVPGRWVDSHDLRPGDVLLLKDQKPARITAIATRPSPGIVYNFAVDDLHCYADRASQVLVHNDCNFVPVEDLQASAARFSGTGGILRRAFSGQNMEDAGITRPADTAAHHIVAGSDARAAEARAILGRECIGINDPDNGVFLPKNLSVEIPTGEQVHSTVHTNAYYRAVNSLMRRRAWYNS